MDQVARFEPQDRSDLFRAAAEKRGVTAGIIEKDFWVCWVLRRIYTLKQSPARIYFKGGTSLAKVFGVIKRMSEDVDLVIDRHDLGFTGARDPATPEPSNKARQRLVKEIKISAHKFVREVLKPGLDQAFSEALDVVGGSATWETALAEDDPDDHTILFKYPTIESPSEYVRPLVRLEFGARGDPWPSVTGAVRPYAADLFPDQFVDADTELPLVVSGERTFWEKATILHMLHHKPEEKPLGHRMVRHYYDLFSLAQHDLGRLALGNTGLLEKVVQHKRLFFPSAWAQYDLAKPGSLRLTPPDYLLRELHDDYNQMANEMIFGEAPEFESVIEGLKETETSVNACSNA